MEDENTVWVIHGTQMYIYDNREIHPAYKDRFSVSRSFYWCNLTITNVQRQDGALYECVSNYGNGVVKQVALKVFDIKAPPTNSSSLEQSSGANCPTADDDSDIGWIITVAAFVIIGLVLLALLLYQFWRKRLLLSNGNSPPFPGSAISNNTVSTETQTEYDIGKITNQFHLSQDTVDRVE
jgi:hypothetical protein